jgi:hypothetical protein
MRMLNPPHPGDFIKTEIIAPLGLSVTARAAAVLGVSLAIPGAPASRPGSMGRSGTQDVTGINLHTPHR